jgi:hypothetical protein
MVNYQNGKVYKIINENNEIVYIGSTVQTLSQRYQRHDHNKPNHKIILIENYSCNSREELCMREQQLIEEHSNLLNKCRAYISKEDRKKYETKYYQNNKEHYKEYHKVYDKKWYENNKEYKKKYREDNKEHYKEYRKNNKKLLKQKTKEYCEKNKELLKQKAKEYYQNNKNDILEKRKEKIKCEFCNCEIQKNNLKRHQKTEKCLNNR